MGWGMTTAVPGSWISTCTNGSAECVPRRYEMRRGEAPARATARSNSLQCDTGVPLTDVM